MPTTIQVVENILSANDQIAVFNRNKLHESHTFSLNLMASPGAGKTSLIEKTVQKLSTNYRIAVIDGDIATSLDADRAAQAGAAAIQINTGGDCHLDAVMLRNALTQLDLSEFDLLIVENVGNLVCPASFDLGTHLNVIIASIPEGDDKPHKYPGMYRGADVVVMNKIDLLPYVDFRRDFFDQGIQVLNPQVEILSISCRTGEGLDQWYEWIEKQITRYRTSQ